MSTPVYALIESCDIQYTYIYFVRAVSYGHREQAGIFVDSDAREKQSAA